MYSSFSSETCSTQGMSACTESIQPRSPALVPWPGESSVQNWSLLLLLAEIWLFTENQGVNQLWAVCQSCLWGHRAGMVQLLPSSSDLTQPGKELGEGGGA